MRFLSMQKDLLLKEVEDDVKHESALLIKSVEEQAKEEAEEKAKKIIILRKRFAFWKMFKEKSKRLCQKKCL